VNPSSKQTSGTCTGGIVRVSTPHSSETNALPFEAMTLCLEAKASHLGVAQ